MLSLMNEARAAEGLAPLVLGDNIAAQVHADNSLAQCSSSHWSLDGLTGLMRYTLAGGVHSNRENVSGLEVCLNRASSKSLEERMDVEMAGLMKSEGHRAAILDPYFHKVNIGLAWDSEDMRVVQQFESDYVTFTDAPALTGTVMTFSGTVRNGIQFRSHRDLSVGLFYLRPVAPLTRGQIARVSCSGHGRPVAFLLLPGRYSVTTFDRTYQPCADPHDIPADSPPPRNAAESRHLYELARGYIKPAISVVGQWVMGKETPADDEFRVNADLQPVFSKHGPGVYSVAVWGWLPKVGKLVMIGEFSLFHETDTSATYSPARWDSP